VVWFDEVCCGAMTRAGCGARCPSHQVPCAGCRGPVEEPWWDANVSMHTGRGISVREIGARMRSFSAPAWMTLSIEKEAGHDQR
jgi:sulfhydrogenase subunit delta